MIDQTRKLEKFKQAVFDDASEKASELISETETECAEKLARAKEEAEQLVENARSAADKEYRAAEVRSVSAGRLESRRHILLKREEIIDKVFANVKKRIAEFAGTPEYKKLMEKKLNECVSAYPDKKGEILISPRDAALRPMLEKSGQFTVRESDNILLGGLTAVYAEDNLALDCTIDSELELQRREFAGRAGLAGVMNK